MNSSILYKIVHWLKSNILTVILTILLIGGLTYASPYGDGITSTTGRYQISCVPHSNSNYPICVRLDTKTGTSSCMSTIGTSSSWSACSYNPW